MTDISTDPLLRDDNLTTAFGSREAGITAVRNVSFEVGRGRVLGIVGESGSGKSVTARSILRLLRRPGHVREGSVTLAGRDSSIAAYAVAEAEKNPFYAPFATMPTP